jgi:hypothetical protein
MNIIQPFKYSICGNITTTFETGEQELPEEVAEYGIKIGCVEELPPKSAEADKKLDPVEKPKEAPLNKSTSAPKNK